MAKHYKRFFVIVADSAGVGEEPDAAKFGDVGSNTWAHAAESVGGLKVPFMAAMGIGELDDILGVKAIKDHKNAYSLRLRETSNGKDTMTGHWEMMGVNTQKPFQTFTDTGFPQELIDELEERTGHKIIGNYSASGTAILVELGEQQMKENSLIVYTSADSVLQIAAHEEVTGLDELYRCCEIAREICMRPEYLVGRVIARPYVGTNKNDFKRVGAHRHDYTVSPTGVTALDILKERFPPSARSMTSSTASASLRPSIPPPTKKAWTRQSAKPRKKIGKASASLTSSNLIPSADTGEMPQAMRIV